jgi:hypothetical protein
LIEHIVPQRYQGVWRRTLLTAPEVYDDRTLVLWMQTARWHADLRIPADRPDCSGCTSLAECSRAQLLCLLKQEGFAGITTVNGTSCEWRRQMDYHPKGWRDRGEMAFSTCARALDEYGIEADYAERWERDPASDQSGWVARSSSAAGPVLWLRSGKRFMLARPRAMDATETLAIWSRASANRASIEELRRLADFEISYGVITGDDGCILHSTLPWRELQSVVLPKNWSIDCAVGDLASGACLG